MFCLTFLLHFLLGISYHKVAFIISKISPKVPGYYWPLRAIVDLSREKTILTLPMLRLLLSKVQRHKVF